MEYVNIMEAARRCQVSDKTIRRWIRAEKLQAHFPQPNRSEIAISDLEPFLPGHLSGYGQETLEAQVVALEQRVQKLEQQVQQMLTKSTPSRASLSASQRPRERTTGSLPRHFVSVLAFAELHRIPEHLVSTHIDISLLPVHPGTWIDHNGQEVVLAFDEKGRQAFHQLYHDTPLFVPCTSCPHSLPGHV